MTYYSRFVCKWLSMGLYNKSIAVLILIAQKIVVDVELWVYFLPRFVLTRLLPSLQGWKSSTYALTIFSLILRKVDKLKSYRL